METNNMDQMPRNSDTHYQQVIEHLAAIKNNAMAGNDVRNSETDHIDTDLVVDNSSTDDADLVSESDDVESDDMQDYRTDRDSVDINIPVADLIKLVNIAPACVSRIDFMKNPELARHKAITHAIFTENIDQTESIAYMGILKGAKWSWLTPANRTYFNAMVAISVAKNVGDVWDEIMTHNKEMLDNAEIYSLALFKSEKFIPIPENPTGDSVYQDIVSRVVTMRPYWLTDGSMPTSLVNSLMQENFSQMVDSTDKYINTYIKAHGVDM